jgi:hypothetical protein
MKSCIVVLPFSEVVGSSERLCLFASEERMRRERARQVESMVLALIHSLGYQPIMVKT